VLGFGRKSLEAAVLLMALYAAVFVPLGERTLWQHALAVFGTPEAQRAGREIRQAGGRMLLELTDFEALPVRGQPRLPELPGPDRKGSGSLSPEP
jgi:hypothetical protein